jgi:hypothetical protein
MLACGSPEPVDVPVPLCSEPWRVSTHDLPPELAEVSGMAPRRLGGWWMVVDSGSPAALYGVDAAGQLEQTVSLDNTVNHDFEALASYGGRLWIGDTGNNTGDRAEVSLLAVSTPEPGDNHATADRYRLHWPDAPRDVEAMTVHAGYVALVAKHSAEVYTAPIVDGAVLEYTGRLDAFDGLVDRMVVSAAPFTALVAPQVTGAALLDGMAAVRTYSHYAWLAGGALVCRGRLPAEQQGEAIGITIHGLAIASESWSYPATLTVMEWR